MRHIQSLTIEMFRVSSNISLPIINNIFKQKGNSRCNLKQISGFSRPLVKSVCHGSESVSFLEPKIWGMVPDVYKNVDTSNTFKNEIKKWKPENCPCRVRKVYINNTGFCLRTKKKLGMFNSIRRSTNISCQYCFVPSTCIFFNLLNLLFLGRL